MNRILLLTAATTLLTLGAAAQPAQWSGRARLIDSTVTALYEAGNFNGNVLVAEKGNVLYRKSFGLAEERTQRKLDEQSIFELASCSKQFTAAGIVILQQQGKLSYDDLLVKWIPALAFYKGVTIRHLLHHSSGLPDYMGLMDSAWDHHKIATNKDVIHLLQQVHPAAGFAPGERMEYSNTGYAVLSSVIEVASGMSYAAFLEKNIFKPLKMTRSFVYSRRLAPRKIDNYAYGYIETDDKRHKALPDSVEGYEQVYCLDGITGDGNVNSTTTDLLKWDRALYSGPLFTPASRKLIFTEGKLNDGSGTAYGFGWLVRTDTALGLMAAHDGSWPGYTSFIERDIDQDKTIIILQNTYHGKMPARTIRDILYNKPLKAVASRKEITLSESVMAPYPGEYELAPGFTITISLEEGQLMAQATGQQKFSLYALSETSFFLKVVEATLDFEKIENGKAQGLILHQNGRDMPGQRIK